MEERIYILDAIVRPDVVILSRPRPCPGAGSSAALTPAAPPETALFDAPIHITALPETVREAFIEIAAVDEPGRVITTVELLSPANRRPGAGREEYARKQADLLRSETSLLEIDLLRTGLNTVAAPIRALPSDIERWDYVACLHRGGWGSEFDIWPSRIRRRIPRVKVPLTPEQADIGLDLQLAFEDAVAAGDYAATIDYSVPPDPPLAPDDSEWAKALLGDAALRR